MVAEGVGKLIEEAEPKKRRFTPSKMVARINECSSTRPT